MPPVLSLSSLTLIASSTVTTSAGLPRSIRRETWRKMRRWSSREKSPSVTTSPILSKAPLSIKRPPRTDCSASIECGGTLRFSSCESEAACGRGWAMKALENLWRRLYRVNAQTKRAARRGPSINGLRLLLRSFPQHRDFDVNEDVGVQRDRDRMVSDGFQRPLRQADHRALDLDHRRIFRHVSRLIERGKPADVVTVDEAIKVSEDKDKTGGITYLAALAGNTPSAHNVRRYAEIVRECAVLRKLIEVSTEIADRAGRGDLEDVTTDLAE